MPSSGMLRHVTLVRTDVSEERIDFIIRVTRISKIGTLAVTSNRSTLRFCQESHGVASQESAIFIVTAVSTSNVQTIRKTKT
jgi:hypothetical protein